jgi:hypothetical protein
LEKTIEKANSRKVQKSLQAMQQAQNAQSANAEAQVELYKKELA